MTEENQVENSELENEENKEVETETVNAEEAAAEAANDMSNVKIITKGDVVEGTILKIEDNQAIVDIGYKYDGTIPLRELSFVNLDSASDAVEVGQQVKLKVVRIDDDKEQLTLSKRMIDSENAWETLESKMESGEIIEAPVAEVVKGGLVVDIGLRGFVPASMVERTFVEDFSDYKGRTLRMKVKEMDKEKNKVILSQKDVLEDEYNAKKQDILAGLESGQDLDGTVQRLTPFGAFVDIGGIDGLVHISEMAWHHVEHPSEVVSEGDAVKVHILKVDPENERISLSIKHTLPSPWAEAAEKFEPGEVVEGEVKRLVSFGAFVEIAPGVEGLVHISQVAHRHIGTPHEVLEEGQQVKVKILDMNIDEKRISLSIKETEEAPEAPAASKKKASNNEPVPANQSLNLTLGERFGDKLSKFK